jgi:hypothetical protein
MLKAAAKKDVITIVIVMLRFLTEISKISVKFYGMVG